VRDINFKTKTLALPNGEKNISQTRYGRVKKPEKAYYTVRRHKKIDKKSATQPLAADGIANATDETI